jgi:hypothetical protein
VSRRSATTAQGADAGTPPTADPDGEGAPFGEPGLLATDGGTVQCHLCGRAYRYPAVHVLRAHGLSANEYRECFGLRASTSLMASALREVFRRVHEPRLRPQWPRIAEIGRTMPPEERSAHARPDLAPRGQARSAERGGAPAGHGAGSGGGRADAGRGPALVARPA